MSPEKFKECNLEEIKKEKKGTYSLYFLYKIFFYDCVTF